MHSSKQYGFGLIELLISIMIGLIVVTGIISMVVAALRANTENLEMTRLTQEMRSVMQLVTRDLRRAGYDQGAIWDFGTGSQTNNEFMQVRVFDGATEKFFRDGFTQADCILFAYDSDGDGGADANEFRGFKLDAANDAIKAKVSGTAGDSDCADTTGQWETLTDAGNIEITDFSLSTRDGLPVPVLWKDPATAVDPIITVREVEIALSGRLANDTSVSRDISQTIRIRNDQMN